MQEMRQVSKVRNILVTGAAGFIGFHLSERLLRMGHHVTGFDNLNSYYDVVLKQNRLKLLQPTSTFQFVYGHLEDRQALYDLFQIKRFDIVINLAAQAGVRYSIQNPYTYIDSNITGFLNILEACRSFPPSHLIFASSSSVYGANKKMPFSVRDNVDHPLALYAVSKKTNELMAHAYASLYKLPVTGLRFFTVYGPYGRPDMALFIFTESILAGKPIDIYKFGCMRRDFTYVDDIVEGIVNLLEKPPEKKSAWDPFHPDPSTSFAPYRIFNIGNNKPIELLRFIEILEDKLSRKAVKNFMPLQDGDVSETFADIQDLQNATGFHAVMPLEEGIHNFVRWYKEYYCK
jgi:UDP-glucuronate 4-epimerase